jgi:ribosomal protein S19E (S16A)
MKGRTPIPHAEYERRALLVLRYIADHIGLYGWAPTTREIKDSAVVPKYTPTGTGGVAEYYLRKLESMGLVRTGFGARTIAITEAGRAKVASMGERQQAPAPDYRIAEAS